MHQRTCNQHLSLSFNDIRKRDFGRQSTRDMLTFKPSPDRSLNHIRWFVFLSIVSESRLLFLVKSLLPNALVFTARRAHSALTAMAQTDDFGDSCRSC